MAVGEYHIEVEEIEPFPEALFRVTVRAEDATTEHMVTLDWAYFTKLRGDREVEAFIQDSFMFLLEREAPSAILSQFNMRTVVTYFPEYEKNIAKK
ncbi:MAG: hypothetical protein ACJKTH_02545 [Patescibacteria group bacterium UBA2163]